MNCAYWRWHPVRQEFELFAQGTSRSVGLGLQRERAVFSEACVIPHFWHVIPGAYYLRQSNPLGHFNPYVYKNIETIADHTHFSGGKPSFGRETTNPPTSSAAVMPTVDCAFTTGLIFRLSIGGSRSWGISTESELTRSN
jgi:hypothetical protein